MKIEAIEIFGFGKLYQIEMKFGAGINLIYGKNEAGKSTLQSFFCAMLFGIERARGRAANEDFFSKYRPWDKTAIFGGRMDVEIAGRRFRIIRDFLKDSRKAEVYDLETGMAISDFEEKILAPAGLNLANYRNTICVSQDGAQVEATFSKTLEDAFMNLGSGGDMDLKASVAIEKLNKKEREIERKGVGGQMAQIYGKLERKKQLEEAVLAAKEELEELSYEEIERGSYVPSILCCFLSTFSFLAALFFQKGNWFLLSIVFAILFLGLANLFFFRARRKRKLPKPRKSMQQKELHQGRLLERIEFLQKELEQYEGVEKLLQKEQNKKQSEEIDLKAIRAARDTIMMLSERMKKTVGTSFTKAMCKQAMVFTDGAHNKLFSQEGGVIVEEGKQCLPLNRFSKGTREQIGLAMRLAAAEVLIKERPVFMLLDDAFVYYDIDRLYKTLTWLDESKQQIFLFTCTEREAETMDECGIAYRYFSLSEDLD